MKGVVVDYLHCVLLGVVKMLMEFWFSKSPKQTILHWSKSIIIIMYPDLLCVLCWCILSDSNCHKDVYCVYIYCDTVYTYTVTVRFRNINSIIML